MIFGTGAIGLATLDALHRRGETVRLVNRSGHAPVADDVEVVGGDAADPEFTTAVSADARVVHRPDGRPLTENIAYAAHTTKSRLRGRMARDLLAAHKAGRRPRHSPRHRRS